MLAIITLLTWDLVNTPHSITEVVIEGRLTGLLAVTITIHLARHHQLLHQGLCSRILKEAIEAIAAEVTGEDRFPIEAIIVDPASRTLNGTQENQDPRVRVHSNLPKMTTVDGRAIQGRTNLLNPI
jgi:hypothetical protein